MSIKLVHTFGRHAGVTQELDKDVVRLGRDPGGDVVFDADFDRDASGNHAELRREGSGWVLVDLRSRNGTFVNGQRVDRRPLASGDEITFGAKGPRVRVELGPRTPAVQAATSAAQQFAPQGGHDGGYRPQAPGPDGGYRPQAPGPDGGYRPQAPGPDGGYRPQAPGPDGGYRPQAPAAGQRVGQRTIAAMISSAVATARGSGAQPMDTKVLAQYVDRQVGAATAGQRRTSIMLGLLLLISLVGLGLLVVWSQWSSDEIDRLRTDLAKLPPNDPRRQDIEGRLGSLHPANASFGRNLYDKSKKGIFMLSAGGQGFCTAFAVRPGVLATNAHCVVAAKKHGGTIVALENEGRGDVSFPVSDMRAHPSYREADPSTLTPDVGLVYISGKAATVLTLATPQELAGLGAGDDVYLIGFPGRLMDTSNPAATFLGAHVGRITTSTGRPGAFADTWLVQHDAPTTHGTSGSPIFNGKGHVIAVNAGGYLEGDEETVSGRKTEVVKASPYKFGMRIDLINAILR